MTDPTVNLARLLRLEVDPADFHERVRMVIDPEFGAWGAPVSPSQKRAKGSTGAPTG
jgi:hypothetical protein